MLKVLNLRKVFDTVVAVDDVSFEVQKGEIFGLLGPNGAGKTTAIRTILNILLPDAGTITFNGSPFSEGTRDLVGYLPEERGLYRKSKVLETILYFAELRGLQRAAAKNEAMRWLKRFDLADRAGSKVEELSKGNQQKIQFVTSILHSPALVILDEPFSGLDPVNQILFQEAFTQLREEGKAVIFSTHQMDQAERLSDSLCLINHGRVVLDGTVRGVKQKYGTNTLHVEFEGNGGFIEQLRGVNRAIVVQNAAEIDVAAGEEIRPLLALLNEKLFVRKFELREPSLQSIFLQAVGVPTNGGGAA